MAENRSPHDIVQTLRTSDEAYKDAAVREGVVWGEVFSNTEMKDVWEADKVAAMKLRPLRGLSLTRIFRDKNLRFGSGLSLACGSGRAERDFIRLGICKRFHGIDIAADAVKEATENAGSMDITYEVSDLNRVTLRAHAYDLVVTQNCLHHVLELEHLAEQIWRSLRPEGYLWIHDYVGETQFQFSDLRLEIANRILEILPDRYRRDRLRDRILTHITRPSPGALVSPFEAIRSAEIIPVFSQWFDIDYRHEEGAFMGRVCPQGMRTNYLETDDGPVIFELLMLIENLLIGNQILAPHTGQYLMRPKLRPCDLA